MKRTAAVIYRLLFLALLAPGVSPAFAEPITPRRLADFPVAHCVWDVARGPELGKLFQGYPGVGAWLPRVRAFGHGA